METAEPKRRNAARRKVDEGAGALMLALHFGAGAWKFELTYFFWAPFRVGVSPSGLGASARG